MYQRAALLSWLSISLVAQVSSLKVYPYLGAECRDEPFAPQEAVPGDCYQLPINAQSAIIQIENEPDYEYTVDFYSSSDCTGTKEASGNSGCIDFTGFGANALSYVSTVEGTGGARRVKGRRLTQPWDADAQRYRDLLGLSPEEATGSLHPSWDPYAHVRAGYGHGNVTETWGETWKWHQIALGVSIGVPIDQWDDNVHRPNDKFMMFGDVNYDHMLTKRWSSDNPASSAALSLDKRWNYGQCRAVLACGRQLAGAAGANLGTGWGQVVHAWFKAKAVGNTLYDWGVNHPITVGVAATGAGTVAGYGLSRTGGGATAQDNDQLGQCGNDTTQQDAFIQSLVEAASASGDNAGEVNITLPDGHILVIKAAVFPQDQKPYKEDLCGAAG